MTRFLLALALALGLTFPAWAQINHYGGAIVGNNSSYQSYTSAGTKAPLLDLNVTDEVILRAAESNGKIWFAPFGSDTAFVVMDFGTPDTLTITGDLDVTGTVGFTTALDVSEGGTGLATLPASNVLLGNGTGDVAAVSVTADGAILIGDGVGHPTSLAAFSSSTGVLSTTYGGTGDSNPDDITGDANEIVVGFGDNTIFGGDVSIGIADNPTFPGNTTTTGTSIFTGNVGVKHAGTIDADVHIEDAFPTFLMKDTGGQFTRLITDTGDSDIGYGGDYEGGVRLRIGRLTNDTDDALDTVWFEIQDDGTVFIEHDLDVEDTFSLMSDVELTVASGVITVTKSFHTVDTASDDPTDSLSLINGGAEGDILVLRSADDARDTTLSESAGVNRLDLNGSFTFTNTHDTITLIHDGSTWLELSRSNNE